MILKKIFKFIWPSVCIGIDIVHDYCMVVIRHGNKNITTFCVTNVAEAIAKIKAARIWCIRSVAAALPFFKVISKTISVDSSLSATEINNFVFFNAEKHFGYALDAISLDYQVLPKNHEQGDDVEIKMVAARREEVAAFLDCFQSSKLKPNIIDVDLLAFERSAIFCLPEKIGSYIFLNFDYNRMFIILFQDSVVLYLQAEYFSQQNLELALPEIKKHLQIAISLSTSLPTLFILSGCAAQNEDLIQMLNNNFAVRIEYAKPFLHAEAYKYMVGFGLALRS